MKDVLSYKGFIGSVHFSADDKVFYGKIEGIDEKAITKLVLKKLKGLK